MRYLYVIVLGLLAQAAYGQTSAETLPADSARYQLATDGRRVNSVIDSLGRCTEALYLEEERGLVREFYPSGRLRAYVPYASLANGVRHGLATTWYENGQLITQEVYLANKREGAMLLFYETGQLKRATQYVAGNELPGSCFGPQGEPVAYFPYEQLPLYPGGYGQLTKEITSALRVPRHVETLAFYTAASVDVSFWVKEDGSIQDPQVTASSHVPALDQAALAAVNKLAKRFYPGKLDGQVVPYRYHLPIQFRTMMRAQLPRF
jgi:protein TonB